MGALARYATAANNIHVRVFWRKNRKEKEVDAQMVSDMTETPLVVTAPQPRTLLVFSGDADYSPAVKKALARGWAVEVYAWQNCLSSGFRQLAASYPTVVKITALDHLIKQDSRSSFYKENLWFNLSRHPIPGERCIVARYDAVPEDSRRVGEDAAKALTSLCKYPCCYCWDDTALLLIVLTPESNEHAPYKFTEDVFEKLKSNQARIVPGAVFIQSRVSALNAVATPASVAEIGVAKVIGQPETQLEDGENEQWTLVRTKPVPRKLRSSQACQYGLCCMKLGKCGAPHSEDEVAFFREHQQPCAAYKEKPCTFRSNCKYVNDTRLCRFAHGKADAICFNCYEKGHFGHDCPQCE